MKLWQKVKYYGLSGEAFEQLDDSILRHNSNMLKNVSFGCSLLMLVFTFSPLVIERSYEKTVVFLISSFLTLVIYIVAERVNTLEVKSKRLNYLLSTVVFVLMIAIGLYISVFTNVDKPAVSFMTILICVQTLIITPIWMKIALNVFATVVFVISSIILKPMGLFIFEVQNIGFAVVAALMLGWNYAHAQCTELSLRLLMEHKSMTDDLTEIGNRRFFFDALEKYTTSSNRLKTGGSIIMLDVDYFKEYNDRYGHPAGDEVLRQIGGVLEEFSVRYGMTVSRIGGEEFAVLWNERRQEIVFSVVLELLGAVEGAEIEHANSLASRYVTVSAGVYMLSTDFEEKADIAYKNADVALYEAKKSGRNRVILYTGPDAGFRAVTQGEIDILGQKRRETETQNDRQ